MNCKRQGLLRQLRLFSLLSIILVLSACATTANKSSLTTLYEEQSDLKILLMPLDVELSLLTAGGLQEPRADWTESAKNYMQKSLETYQQDRGAKLVKFETLKDQQLESTVAEIERLHSAVGTSILIHEFIPQYKLPTKTDKFEWTLGPSVSVLNDQYDADYALFIFVRDSYSSSGRILLTAAAALLGVGLQNGTQVGFASLVDLKTGEVSWFNRLFSTTGDIRTAESAEKTVAVLLDGLPQ